MDKLPPSCTRCENLLSDLRKCLDAFKTFISVDSTVDPNILVTSLEQLFKRSSNPQKQLSARVQEKSYRMATTQTDNNNPSVSQCQCKCQIEKIQPTIRVQKKTAAVLAQEKKQSHSKKSGKKGKGKKLLRPKAFRSKNAYDTVPPETLKKASASVREVSLDTVSGGVPCKIYECNTCNRQFPRKANAQNHFLIMHEKQGVRCVKCRKIYFSKEVFRRHTAVCNAPPSTWREIRTQIQTEEKVKSFSSGSKSVSSGSKSVSSGSKSVSSASKPVASTSKSIEPQSLKPFKRGVKSVGNGQKSVTPALKSFGRGIKSVTNGSKSTIESYPVKLELEGGKISPNKIKAQVNQIQFLSNLGITPQAQAQQRVTRDTLKRLADEEPEDKPKNIKTVSKNQNQEKIRLNLGSPSRSTSASAPASASSSSDQPKKIFGSMVTKNKTTRNFLMENQNGRLSRVFGAAACTKKSPTLPRNTSGEL